MKTSTVFNSPVGMLTAVCTDGVLSGLYMPDAAHLPDSFGVPAPGTTAALEAELAEYFAGQRTRFTVPTAAVGTEFQARVWAALVAIPYGETRTYADIARSLGDPNLVRAVGAANARNPISILVPCHRVVGSDGQLTGYAGGLDRKEFLLSLENPGRAVTQQLF